MKIKIAWFVLLGALIAALPVRVYQMLYLVDPSTGFFTDHNFSAVCLSAFLLIAAVAMFVLCFCQKDVLQKPRPVRSIPSALAALLGGAGIIVHSVYALMQDNQAHASLSQDAANAAAAMESGQVYLNVIMAFVGVAAGIVVLLAAVNFAFGKNLFRSVPVLAILPPLWFCINLITLFTNYTNVTYMTENMMDMFAMISVTFFLLSQGKLFARVNLAKTGKRVYAFGLPTILYGFVSALPSFVLQVMNLPHTSSLKTTLNLAIFLIALYALVFLLTYPRAAARAPKRPPQNPQPNAPQSAAELPPEPTEPAEEPPRSIEPPQPLQSATGSSDELSLQIEDDGREIPYLIQRDPIFDSRKKERKPKRKKKRSIFYFIPFVKKRVDKKEAEAARPAWSPAPRQESTVRLENDWLLDFYGYQRRAKNDPAPPDDTPYIPKVHYTQTPPDQTS